MSINGEKTIRWTIKCDFTLICLSWDGIIWYKPGWRTDNCPSTVISYKYAVCYKTVDLSQLKNWIIKIVHYILRYQHKEIRVIPDKN